MSAYFPKIRTVKLFFFGTEKEESVFRILFLYRSGEATLSARAKFARNISIFFSALRGFAVTIFLGTVVAQQGQVNFSLARNVLPKGGDRCVKIYAIDSSGAE